MAQLKCPECGKKFSTPTAKCPHCGSQINKDGKVIVISLVKNLFDFPDFYRNPTIEIRQKGFKHVGEVNYNEKFELAIDKECELIFKCNYVNLPFATCEVKPGDAVYLTYDKGLNSLRTIKVHNKEYNIPVVDKKNRYKVNFKLLLVLICVCGLFAGAQILESHLIHKHRQKAKQQQTTSLNDIKKMSSIEIENLPQAIEYEDIKQQFEIWFNAQDRFLYEVGKIPEKISLPEYQGIMRQTIFRDANKALDEFNDEDEKLERLLRQHGFLDEADILKQEREYLNKVYLQERREIEYGK